MYVVITAFIAFLVAQGIPCTGYSSFTSSGKWPPEAIVLTFDKSATQDQIKQAYALVPTFDAKTVMDKANMTAEDKVTALEARIMVLEAKLGIAP